MGLITMIVLVTGLCAAVLILWSRGSQERRAFGRRLFLPFLIGLLLLAGLFVYLRFSSVLDVDRCLDRGGRWNAETGSCEGIAEAESMP